MVVTGEAVSQPVAAVGGVLQNTMTSRVTLHLVTCFVCLTLSGAAPSQLTSLLKRTIDGKLLIGFFYYKVTRISGLISPG